MTIFTVICGFATILSFVFQLREIFPKFKGVFIAVGWLALGALGTSVLIPLSNTTFVSTHTISPLNVVGYVLFVGSALLAAIFLLAGIFLPEKERRKEAKEMGSNVSTFLGFLLFAFLPMLWIRSTEADTSNGITIDERIVCSRLAVEHSDYERAISYLTEGLNSIDPIDSRREIIDNLLNDTRRKRASKTDKLAGNSSDPAKK